MDMDAEPSASDSIWILQPDARRLRLSGTRMEVIRDCGEPWERKLELIAELGRPVALYPSRSLGYNLQCFDYCPKQEAHCSSIPSSVLRSYGGLGMSAFFAERQACSFQEIFCSSLQDLPKSRGALLLLLGRISQECISTAILPLRTVPLLQGCRDVARV